MLRKCLCCCRVGWLATCGLFSIRRVVDQVGGGLPVADFGVQLRLDGLQDELVRVDVVLVHQVVGVEERAAFFVREHLVLLQNINKNKIEPKKLYFAGKSICDEQTWHGADVHAELHRVLVAEEVGERDEVEFYVDATRRRWLVAVGEQGVEQIVGDGKANLVRAVLELLFAHQAVLVLVVGDERVVQRLVVHQVHARQARASGGHKGALAVLAAQHLVLRSTVHDVAGAERLVVIVQTEDVVRSHETRLFVSIYE